MRFLLCLLLLCLISTAGVTSAADPEPTRIFQGTADTTKQPSNARRFAERMKKQPRRCELIEFDVAKHGFFNRGEAFARTLSKTDEFLTSLGFLPKR